MYFYVFRLLVLLLSLLSVVCPNFSETMDHKNHPNPSDLENELRITERIGENVYVDNLVFTTSQGDSIKISEIIHTDIPTLLIPLYYRCPHMCSLILDNLVRLIQKEERSGYQIGVDYKIVLFSINPNESHLEAKKKKQKYIALLDDDIKERVQKQWYFLTGSSQSDIDMLAKAIGFKYKKLKEDYIHSALFVFADVEAKINRYLYDIRPSQIDYHIALLEVLDRKVSSIKDHVLMFCFKYVPAKRHYMIVAWRVMVLLVGFFFLLFILFFLFLWFKESSKKES